MIRPNIPPDLATVDEFYESLEDGQKADLIDGVIRRFLPRDEP